MPVKRPHITQGKFETHPCVLQVELFEEAMREFRSILTQHESHLSRVSNMVVDGLNDLKTVIKDQGKRLNELDSQVRKVKRETGETKRLLEENLEEEEDE